MTNPLRTAMPDSAMIANQHRDAITRKIADLTALAGELDALIDSCSDTVADCRIIEALDPS